MNESKILEQLLKLAQKSNQKNEVPVSAILTYKNKIIAKAYNKREKTKNIMDHAEILAIKTGSKKLKRWNLSDCNLYVSLKPCNMCMEVIKQSRIKNVYYFLQKPENKKEYNKTNFYYIENSDFLNSYSNLLSSFFQNKR